MANDEYGDFQTPEALVALARRTIPAGEYRRVLDPTCGVGNFLASFNQSRTERVGIEINPDYAEQARSHADLVIRADIFVSDLATIPWKTGGDLLVVGNPPWVTTSQLGRFGSANGPAKSNIGKIKGIDALTGASNFDIAETVLLKVMVELDAEHPTIAMLVKTQVARNVFVHAATNRLPYSRFTIRRIDADEWFGAAVDACLFTMVHDRNPTYECAVYEQIDSTHPVRTIAVSNGTLTADLGLYNSVTHVDGRSPVDWRSGVNHGAAKVIELDQGRAAAARIEDEYLYPMLKCTDVHHGRAPTKLMVLPQTRHGQSTAHLETTAPHLWSYLTGNAAALDGRRSRVFEGQPRFAMFGLGPYTFSPYKVAVSGLHKDARFRLVGPHNRKPVVVDTGAYTTSFNDPAEAALVHAILSGADVRSFISAVTFSDAKRPINKKVLQRIDLAAVVAHTDRDALCTFASRSAEQSGIHTVVNRETLDALTNRWAAKLR